MIEFEALFTARKVHMQEKIARALAREREVWQRDREMRVAAMDRDRSQFQTELALHQGYSMLLAGELRAACFTVPTTPEIPG